MLKIVTMTYMPWSGSHFFPHLHHFKFPLRLPFFPFITLHSFHSSHMPPLIGLRPLTMLHHPPSFLKNIYLAVLYLSCSVWDLWSLLWQAGSLFLYLFSCGMQTWLWHVGSSSLTVDWTPGPMHWERRVLPTGPPGKHIISWMSSLHPFLALFYLSFVALVSLLLPQKSFLEPESQWIASYSFLW